MPFSKIQSDLFRFLASLFMKDGEVVQPDPDRLADYQIHAGQRRGQWPGSPEISSAMFERHLLCPRSG